MSNHTDGPREPLDGVDAAILSGVRQLWETRDPMPAGLIDLIQFAVDLNDAGLEVSRLLEADQPAAARTDEHTRLITFQSPSLTVMITIEPAGNDAIRIDGWLTPAATHEVVLRTRTAPMTTTSDETGRFSLHGVPAGAVQLVVALTGTSRRVVTPSIVL